MAMRCARRDGHAVLYVAPMFPEHLPAQAGPLLVSGMSADAARDILAGHSGESIGHDIAGTGGIQKIEAGYMTGDDTAVYVTVSGEILPGQLVRSKRKPAPDQTRAPDFNGSGKLRSPSQAMHRSCAATLSVSERRVCRTLGQHRSTQRKVPNGLPDEERLTPKLKSLLRRRGAIEPEIGHMKTDGRLPRCPLKGAAGDAVFAVLCGCGHNIRKILAHIRGLLVAIISRLCAILKSLTSRPAHPQPV